MQELLYCMKISRHENFAVSRLGSKNREIKMPRKMILELDRAKLKCREKWLSATAKLKCILNSIFLHKIYKR